MRVRPEDLPMTDVDPAVFMRQTVDDAARFRDTQAVLADYLRRYRLFIVEHYGWCVFWQDFTTHEQRKLGVYPTYAQALDKALYEAERAIKAAGNPAEAD